jgi:hypothetical protein
VALTAITITESRMQRWELWFNQPWARPLALFMTGLALPFPLTATTSVPTPVTLGAFTAQLNDVFQGRGDAFELYVALHETYGKLSEADRRQAGQLLSMVDAMFGRYQDASAHYEMSFPASSSPAKCPPSAFRPVNTASAIKTLAGKSRVLLINESHSKVETRASILDMLPVLKRAGYTHLALEALAPADQGTGLRDSDLAARGYVIDDPKAGFYLREPVYAQLIRSALAEGFSLVAYESHDTDHEKREDEQARRLARWLREHPGERLVVLAGYSHIWKRDGWMAERLAKLTGTSPVSLDQVEAIGRCKIPRNGISNATSALWFSPDAHAWSARPDQVDATATFTGGGRGDAASWLTLDGLRVAVLRRTCPLPHRGPWRE